MINDVALHLIKARESSGLTQRDVALFLGVSQSVLSKVESGERPPSVQLAAALSFLYNRRFEDLYAELFDVVRADMSAQLPHVLGRLGRVEPDTTRGDTVRGLRERLDPDKSLAGHEV